MIDTPHIAQSPEQLTAVIHITVPRAEIQTAMDPAIGELLAVVAAQGIGPAGPLYSYHRKTPTEIFDFELGVPITAAVAPTGRVYASTLPAATVARTIYHGPYEGLGAAWGEFCAWIAANGHAPAPGLWERYLAGPESSPDSAHWRTELNRPLV